MTQAMSLALHPFLKTEPADVVPDLSLDLDQDSIILLEDSFIGVTDPVQRPPDVAFVDTAGVFPNNNQSAYEEVTTTTNHQHFYHSNSNSFPATTTSDYQYCQPTTVTKQLANSSYQQTQQPNDIFPADFDLTSSFNAAFDRQTSNTSTIRDGYFGDDRELASWFEEQTDFNGLFQDLNAVVNESAPPPCNMGEKGQKDILQEIIRECEVIEAAAATAGSPRSSDGGAVSPAHSFVSSYYYGSSTDVDTPMTLADGDASPAPSVFSDSRSDSLLAAEVTADDEGTATKQRLSGVKTGGVGKRRSREQAKLRKKEQNREAAARYRDKKRLEKFGTESELTILQKRNTELHGQVEDAMYEIRYLRKLMKEISTRQKEAK